MVRAVRTCGHHAGRSGGIETSDRVRAGFAIVATSTDGSGSRQVDTPEAGGFQRPASGREAGRGHRLRIGGNGHRQRRTTQGVLRCANVAAVRSFVVGVAGAVPDQSDRDGRVDLHLRGLPPDRAGSAGLGRLWGGRGRLAAGSDWSAVAGGDGAVVGDRAHHAGTAAGGGGAVREPRVRRGGDFGRAVPARRSGRNLRVGRPADADRPVGAGGRPGGDADLAVRGGGRAVVGDQTDGDAPDPGKACAQD